MNHHQKTKLKIQYLYQLYEELENTEDFTCRQQQNYLLQEIDYQKTEILKTIVQQKLKEIENE
jgi:hypothetical protein